MASSEKIEMLRNRVNLFWSCIRVPLEEAVKLGELDATELDIRDLTQSLYFFLGGAASTYESRLIDEKYFSNDDETSLRHISRLMNRYHWKRPITQEMMQDMTLRISEFLDKSKSKIRTCETCLGVGTQLTCRNDT